MSDILTLLAAFMEAERARLRAAAQRSRVLDHDTNRGSDFERAVRQWAREFVEPEYAVSTGEVIDSFNTFPDVDRRQLDLILHQDTRHARRFSFGGDLRLVPIECVALTMEVKLSIDHVRFVEADKSAAMTNALRLGLDRITRPLREDPSLPGELIGEGLEYRSTAGTLVSDAYKRVWFGIFVDEGPNLETLAGWLRQGTTIDFICCLSSGCAFRLPFARNTEHDVLRYCDVAPADRALVHLATVLQLSLNNFEYHSKRTAPAWDRYHPYMSVRHWDTTGFKEPPGMKRLPQEQEEFERMRALKKIPARKARNQARGR